MDPLFYKLLHVTGLMLLFSGVGLLLFAGGEPSRRKPALVLHGSGLALLLLGGFGMLAKLGAGAPEVYALSKGWILLKLAVWLFFGAAMVLVKKGVLRGQAGIWICVLAGALAAWAGLFKPFL